MGLMREIGLNQVAVIVASGLVATLVVLVVSMASTRSVVHRCVDWLVTAICIALIGCGSSLQFMGLGHGAATSAMIVQAFWTKTIFGHQPITYLPVLIIAVLGPASVLAALCLPLTPMRSRGVTTVVFSALASFYWLLPVVVTEVSRGESALYGGPILLAVLVSVARFLTIVYIRRRREKASMAR